MKMRKPILLLIGDYLAEPMFIELATDGTIWVGATGIYNLHGQRVTKPAKGLYIVNGKKRIYSNK